MSRRGVPCYNSIYNGGMTITIILHARDTEVSWKGLSCSTKSKQGQKTTTITSTTTKINHDTTWAFISYDEEGCTETHRHTSNDNKPQQKHEILYLNHGPPFAKDSTRIYHVMPGLLNSHNGVSPHEQANHVALFLDRCLSRDTME